MTGRVCIVTGANTGLGFEVARYLCEGGNDVILGCRNEDKGKVAVDKIKAQNPSALATFMKLDVADKESVKSFVDEFHKSEKRLDVLVNNAGMALNFKEARRQKSKDGFEVTVGTNHLGSFYLTNLLLDDLKKTGSETQDSRIVNVVSRLHDSTTMTRMSSVELNLDDLMYDEGTRYNGLQAYKDSKCLMIMCTYKFSSILEGSGVTCNCVCPGLKIPSTKLGQKGSFRRKVIGKVTRLFDSQACTVKQARDRVMYCIVDDKVKGVTGKYFVDMAEATSSAETLDAEKQDKAWQLSGGYLKMDGFEPVELKPDPVPEEPIGDKKEEEKAKTEEKKDEEKTDVAEEKKDDEADKKTAEVVEKKEEKEPEEPKKEKEEEKKEPEAEKETKRISGGDGEPTKKIEDVEEDVDELKKKNKAEEEVSAPVVGDTAA